jgi:perosamine synthetase
MTLLTSPLPRGPVLGWSNFEMIDAPGIASVENLKHTTFTTSGRAAIYQALLQLQLPKDSTVLVPTYHCPTMVAPVLLANLKVAYFGLKANGMPQLDTIDPATAGKSKVMLVSHYFGLANSLAEVRRWCDERNVALIEDCAHCYFGQAGERPVGAWGDFSTASLSKFLPVPEGGLLASANRSLSSVHLPGQNMKAQLKGWIDVLELASRHKRFAGLNSLLAFVFRLKNSARLNRTKLAFGTASTVTSESDVVVDTMMRDCDMGRINLAPLWASMTLKSVLPRGRVIARRQENYARYAKNLVGLTGARQLFPLSHDSASQIAPYVFPLWVDDADRVYQALKAQDLPVFRWDRIWPGTPQIENDVGPLWSQHVLQLLCHQDLSRADIERTCRATLALLATPTEPFKAC